MRLRRKVAVVTLVFLSLISSTVYSIPKPTHKTLDITNDRVYLKNKEWASKIEYTVGKDKIPFNFEKTYNYEDNEYKGTLIAKKVIITPNEKIANKYYINEQKTFTKYLNKNFGNKDSNNFSSTLKINENGYIGDIPRRDIKWTENWDRGRKQWIETTHESGWTQGTPQNTINYSYYDSGSKRNIDTTLEYRRVLETRTKTGYRYSQSSGNRFNYQPGSNNIGYMSQDIYSYWGGMYLFKNSPRRPTDYYGDSPDKEGWELVDCNWDEEKVYSADEVKNIYKIRKNLLYKNNSYWWKSETGKLNKYRRGIFLKYRKPTEFKNYKSLYGGMVNLPDYIRDYTGNAKYEGTLSKKIEKVNYTCNYWNVNIVYEGNLNLKNVAVGGKIIPNPSKQGSKIDFNITTKYYPNKIDIYIPHELQSYFKKSVISMNIDERLYLNTVHSEILDLYIPETINKEGKRVKNSYEFKVVATRSDGNKDEDIFKLDINGSILDNLKTIILY